MTGTVPRSAGAALLLTAVLSSSCGGDGRSDVTAPGTATTTPAPLPTAAPQTSAPSATPRPSASADDGTEWATCTTERADLVVSYPAQWTAAEHSAGGCAYFDPGPIDVETGTEGPAVAVRLDVESVAFERVREGYLRGDVRSRRDTTVAGHQAVRIEDRDTGGPLAAKGRRLTYLADLGRGRTLVLTTNEADADDPARAREVVDAMAQRLQRAR